MNGLGRRVAAVGRVVEPASDRSFLAYARAVVAYGGGEPGGGGFEATAQGLARWLEGGRRTTCGPG